MLFSSGTLGRFSTILTGTLANPSMYCSGHNNLPPLRLPREGKLIIPETFKLFPDISLRFGPPGVGKSHLAIGLGRKVVEQGHTVRFTTATALLAVLGKAESEGGLS